MIRQVLLVGLGGFLGSVCRFLVTTWTQALIGTAFPWGTAFVNIAGCFLIGLVMTLSIELSSISADMRLFLVTGILGGLTTFSSFGYESMKPMLEGSLWTGVANIVLNLSVGLAAVYLGILLARMLR